MGFRSQNPALTSPPARELHAQGRALDARRASAQSDSHRTLTPESRPAPCLLTVPVPQAGVGSTLQQGQHAGRPGPVGCAVQGRVPQLVGAVDVGGVGAVELPRERHAEAGVGGRPLPAAPAGGSVGRSRRPHARLPAAPGTGSQRLRLPKPATVSPPGCPPGAMKAQAPTPTGELSVCPNTIQISQNTVPPSQGSF